VADTDGDGLDDGLEVRVTLGTDPNNPDTDGGSVDDLTELLQGTDPLNPADDPVDTDGDGLSDQQEATRGTDPDDPDTDDDELSDGDEAFTHGTDPLDRDTDDDGLTDRAEVISFGTNPLLPDTDGGSVDDLTELLQGTDPLNPADDPVDTDGDGLSDQQEATRGTDPHDPDTDDGGMGDGQEVARGSNPLSASDDAAPVSSSDGQPGGVPGEAGGGDAITAVGEGFDPGEDVVGTLFSTPVPLGVVTADPAGRAVFTFTVPTDLDPGIHTVELVGLTSGRVLQTRFLVPDTRPIGLSITDTSLVEGDRGLTSMGFEIVLDRPATETVVIWYHTRGGTATALRDFVPWIGLVLVRPGESSAAVRVLVVGDRTKENDEHFDVVIGAVPRVDVVDGAARGVIIDDDRRR
jgi:hypothetical protein